MRILNVLHPLLDDYQVSGSALLGISIGEYLNKNYEDITVDYIASSALKDIISSDSKASIYTPDYIRKSRAILDTIEYTKSIFESKKYDIIHINISQMSVLSAIDRLLKGIPVVYTQHTASILGRFSLNYRDNAKSLSNGNPLTRIVCPSNSMLKIWEQYISSTKHDNVLVIRNGIKEYSHLKREIPSKDCDTYISVGRLEPCKGMLEIAELCDKYNHKIIMVAGESQGTMTITEELQEYFDRFDEICERRKDIITRYYYLPNEEIRRLMMKSKGYISLSKLESYGLAVAEAVASGTPLFYLEEAATKEFTAEDTSLMIPKSEIYRKSHNKVIDIYEKYLKEFESKINSGIITNQKVLDYSKTLKLSVKDCSEQYLDLYKTLVAQAT